MLIFIYLFFADGGVAQAGDEVASEIMALLFGVDLLGVSLDLSNRAVRELVLPLTVSSAGGIFSTLVGPWWSSPLVGTSASGAALSSVYWLFLKMINL